MEQVEQRLTYMEKEIKRLTVEKSDLQEKVWKLTEKTMKVGLLNGTIKSGVVLKTEDQIYSVTEEFNDMLKNGFDAQIQVLTRESMSHKEIL